MAATAFLEFYRFKTMSKEESEKAKGEWQNGPNLEPQTIHSNDTTTKTVIIGNARSLSPVVVDSTGQNATYLPINAKYTMDGTKSYLNSGWMWPEDSTPYYIYCDL
jgi:hypothetical protein